MKNLDTRAINSINISGKNMSEASFEVFVITAATEENAEQLNRRFHKHNFFELHFVTEGYVGYGFGDKSVTVEAGQMIIISPENIHSVTKMSESFCKIMVGIEAKPDSVTEQSLLKLSDRVIEQSIGVKNSIEDILSAVQKKLGKKNKGILVRQSIFSLIYKIIGRTDSDCPENISHGLCDDRVVSAKKYIRDNPDMFFTCTEVAVYCHLSTKQLGRLFKKYEGMSLLDYIHREKIEQAKHLLLNTAETQGEIAKKLGFLDAQYFGKFFCRITGRTPAVFRGENNIHTEG